ncbi:hypothetical protein [Bradyrhizobium sp. Leo121]|uniref:hypothetical protein n=1 Tax=Bradyrhizobium sp. Leo121 TaxID=1571195 RepID=UPI0010291BFE|nr:hypothetical protein [Bradyrhizobium sp. Leo121]RZN15413.1 hypothetical protein CWO90_41615 [Bradyrhizobium sp. Leo121]
MEPTALASGRNGCLGAGAYISQMAVAKAKNPTSAQARKPRSTASMASFPFVIGKYLRGHIIYLKAVVSGIVPPQVAAFSRLSG